MGVMNEGGTAGAPLQGLPAHSPCFPTPMGVGRSERGPWCGSVVWSRVSPPSGSWTHLSGLMLF